MFDIDSIELALTLDVGTFGANVFMWLPCR